MKFILFFLLSFSTVAPVNNIWAEIGKNIELKIFKNNFTSIHRYDLNVVYIISELPSVITYQRLTNIEGQGGKHSIPIMPTKSILSPENEDALQKLYSELTKEAHEVIYIYIRKLDCPFINDPNEIYKQLNDKVMSDNGPRFIFGGIIKDIDKVYDITDDTWNNFLIPLESRNQIRIGLTVDNNLFHIFTIDKNEIDYTSLLGEMDPPTFKFISNFNINTFIKSILEPAKFKGNHFFPDAYRHFNLMEVEFIDDEEDGILFVTRIYYHPDYKDNEFAPRFLDALAYNHYFLAYFLEYVEKIKKFQHHEVVKIFKIIKSLSNSNLLKNVITRILSSENSAAKILVLEFAYKMEIITLLERNWINAYNLEMQSNEVATILHSTFLQNIVKKLSDLKDFDLLFELHYFFISYITVIYVELEKFVDQCKIDTSLRCSLLTDYNAIETSKSVSSDISTMSLITDKAIDIINTRLMSIMGDTDPKSLRFHQLNEGGEILMKKFNETRSKTILIKSGSEDNNMLTKKIFYQLKSLNKEENIK